MKRELESIEIPGESEARARAWNVVSAAFADRQPVERPSRRLRLAIAVAVVVAAVAAVLSSPGQAVLDEVREVVGVERAQPALFSLPSTGQLLVASDAGVWVVQEDGSKRLLGPYREASWSPFGRFVVAARENELTALEPDGDVRWTLSRPGVRFPRWTGTAVATRGSLITVRALPASSQATGWRRTGLRGSASRSGRVAPGCRLRARVRGFARRGLALHRSTRELLDPDSGAAIETGRAGPEWSSDGSGDSSHSARKPPDSTSLVHGAGESLFTGSRTPRGAFRAWRWSRQATSSRLPSRRTDVALLVADRRRSALSGRGALEQPAWSADGRWLLVGWPSADQWVFVRADGKRIRAVSNVAEQFRSDSFPRIEGWCCSP